MMDTKMMRSRSVQSRTTMSLCKQVYETLTSFPGKPKVVQFIPQIDMNSLFMVHEEVGAIDIGITKQNYLSAFKQAHGLWHSQRELFTQALTEVAQSDLYSIFYVTVTYLFTTNDHHQVFKLHERILAELYRRDAHVLEAEFEIITTLLSSRLSKINKNSLLWNLLRKLTVMMNFDGGRFNVLLARVLQSCRLHYANYYGNNYLRWLIGVSIAVGDGTKVEAIRTQLTEVCHESLADVSLWTNLRVLLYADSRTIQAAVYQHVRAVDEVNRKFGVTVASPVVADSPTTTTHNPQFALDQLHWLLSVECCNITPYASVVPLEQQAPFQPVLVAALAAQNKRAGSFPPDHPALDHHRHFIAVLQHLTVSASPHPDQVAVENSQRNRIRTTLHSQ
ncbi:hypothetical protein CANTEDRAFT_133107 [Yamadazyma tenuis ATCC 10573]|uniref:Uncharacterized protein n=1 Tax=Candida tenuis (strain ATCC 10573 / BCRC 21748 / CBS 615 / JCM 9827 / NBRC 10315 / NRRL Y-1498 / VKM Y-70) TaxID=590646 RepID=G3AXU5_CANTC|nr:uncharacterized protein CANTEDRAFT_133107 [Yamadazyma tenuis ATCC 10573]EGV66319.1 hypothetical protein CANTEDRAFT_133107 [Yamadazyma tenuis ATCC 10573]